MENLDLKQLDGVGLRTEEKFFLNGIKSVRDLLEYFPYNFIDYELGINKERATVIGKIVTIPVSRFIKRNMNRMTFKLKVNEKIIEVIIFNRQFLKTSLVLDEEVIVTGKYDSVTNKLTASDITFKYVSVKPVYSLKELPLGNFKKALKSAVEKYGNELEETLPNYLLKKYKLISYKDSIRIAHFPNSIDEIKHLKRRVKYEELLKYQMLLQYSLYMNKVSNGTKINYSKELINEFIKSLPFKLTDSQSKSVNEILLDLNSDYSMNRLVQGDVGSGKTVVAITALYAAYTAGFQSAFMAPTEILSEQHYINLKKLLPELSIRLLTASVKAKDRRDLLTALESGEIDIIVGTHSLFQDDVIYHNLGLVITDEQHRFGVEQRKRLRGKGFFPDVLHMSATPIPRTLAITLFGDMDVSTIKELPKGRKPIKTKLFKTKDMDRILGFIEKEIDKGRQAYIVTALISESDKIELQNAMDVFNDISNRLSSKVELLHGKMKNEDKETIMKDFKDHKIDCLVSTTVIEVGVDVPNATVMVILDADRFGLSQLHQLRGRIGRGEFDSYCFLVSDNTSNKAKERLRIIESTLDGFELSEADLRLRGPGDFFGVRQSGYPSFKYADLINDINILNIARDDAKEIVYNINDKNNQILKRYILNNMNLN
ncbi:ATP-dependent DNA helicase RecG [Mycoplasmatota bacterium WC44]